jgi:hypothetical protein
MDLTSWDTRGLIRALWSQTLVWLLNNHYQANCFHILISHIDPNIESKVNFLLARSNNIFDIETGINWYKVGIISCPYHGGTALVILLKLCWFNSYKWVSNVISEIASQFQFFSIGSVSSLNNL